MLTVRLRAVAAVLDAVSDGAELAVAELGLVHGGVVDMLLLNAVREAAMLACIRGTPGVRWTASQRAMEWKTQRGAHDMARRLPCGQSCIDPCVHSDAEYAKTPVHQMSRSVSVAGEGKRRDINSARSAMQ